MEPEQPPERNSTYFYFLQEAPELLSDLEQELLSLSQENISITKIHSLLRIAHTLKGAAASAGLATIQTVAHSLEDVFRAVCRPNVEIDSEAKALIFEGFECLRLPLVAEFSGNSIDHAQVLDRTATIFAQLQEKLGDYFDQETQIPTSEELGFDLIQSIFETGVAQRLEQLAVAIAQGQQDQVAALLQAHAENFAGVGESLGLPGFEAIGRMTLAALVAAPEQAVSIARVALEDFRQGQLDVLAGDRTQGGQPSTTLLGWDNAAANQMVESIDGQESEVSSSKDLLIEESSSESPLLEMIWGEEEQALPQLEPDAESTIVDARSDSLKVETAIPASLGPSVPPRSSKKEGVPARSVRIDVEHLAALNYLLAELLTTYNHQSSQDERLRDAVLFLLNRLRQYQYLLNQLRDCSERLLFKSATVVPSNRRGTQPSLPSNLQLDALELDQYGELQEVVQAVLEGATKIEAATDTINLLTRQGTLTLEKQRRQLNNARDVLMEARMLPLGEILHRFPDVLRQLETLQKKPVTLQLSGTEVLADKTVAERLYDPLLHIVRNAFDHGIESPELRRQAGKPEQGRIEIRAYHRGGQLVIEVQDDGQGLNYDKIRQRAVQGEFVSAQQAEQLSPAQLLPFLFKPGFSTAAQVNELSGRGVGLDVVQTQLQALQGAVTVQSQPQQGTTFLLRIPLSLTVARLLLCQAGSRTYGFLAEAVELVLRPRAEQLRSWEGGKVLRWGKGSEACWIPVYSLADSLTYFSSIPDGSELLAENPQPVRSLREAELMLPIMLIRYGGGLLGIEVDQALGEQELVVRPLSVTITSPLYVYGSSILASSQLALVIDGAALAERILAQQVPSQVKPSQAPLPSKPPQLPVSVAAESPPMPGKPRLNSSSTTLLVVEDSVTVRQALMTTLQKAGYQVLQAQHGQEAIALLQQLPEISLVICDIEMPRMNGFEFLNYRQQQPKLAGIPVVMLTSRSAEKHRKIAMNLGASGYLTKPYMEQDLLTAVADSLLMSSTCLCPTGEDERALVF